MEILFYFWYFCAGDAKWKTSSDIFFAGDTSQELIVLLILALLVITVKNLYFCYYCAGDTDWNSCSSDIFFSGDIDEKLVVLLKLAILVINVKNMLYFWYYYAGDAV